VLFSKQQITHEEALSAPDPATLQRLIIERRKSELTRIGFLGLEKTFEGIGLPIFENPTAPEQHATRANLLLLSASRNVIEHNRSVVNNEFLALVPGSVYKVGDIITITVAELGDALATVEWTAEHLNSRAIAKFGL
jgi:hypothetical protein